MKEQYVPTPMGESFDMAFKKKPKLPKITRADIRQLRTEDLVFGWEDDPRFQNLHYSKKGGHAARSRQTPRKRSRRR